MPNIADLMYKRPMPTQLESDHKAFIGDGGAAFPSVVHSFERRGMMLRDYFAAQAMTGLIRYRSWTNEDLGQRAYEIADAMLKARQGT